MIVKRAAVLGRCMGVRRAVDLALRTAKAEKGKGGGQRKVFTLGPLIHNPKTVAELEASGIFAIHDRGGTGAPCFVDGGGNQLALSGSVVVIRAHGIPPAQSQALEQAGASIVDATCPRVLASQRRARDFALKGWTVVIAGDRDHGEVTGIAGFAPGALIVASPEEAARVDTTAPLALIAQTTIKREEYLAIRKALAARKPLLEVVDSICPATTERLASLADLATDCDALVVVGGRNSANTARLHRTALATGLPSWLVEEAADLPKEIFSFARVGVTAGASTPDEAIDEVEAALLGLRPQASGHRPQAIGLRPQATVTIDSPDLPVQRFTR